MKKFIVCFGEILWDRFPDGKKPGGAPMNITFHIQRQGLGSSLISSIGKDTEGTELLDYMAGQGLSAAGIQIHPSLKTGSVTVKLDEHKHASYTIEEPVSWDEITFNNDSCDLISGSDAFIFGTLACRNEVSRSTLFRLLPFAGLKILDLNLRPPHYNDELIKALIDKADILKVNEEELVYLSGLYDIRSGDTGQQLGLLMKHLQLKTICVTLGDKGAIAICNNKIYKHPGFKVQVSDTVGSGDAFLAALTTGILNRQPFGSILRTACATGALVASSSGANPGYSSADIEKILSSAT